MLLGAKCGTCHSAPSSSSLCFPCDYFRQKTQSLLSFLEDPSWPNGIHVQAVLELT